MPLLAADPVIVEPAHREALEALVRAHSTSQQLALRASSFIEWEEQERARRSLERRLKDAHIGRFKPLCDFDWA